MNCHLELDAGSFYSGRGTLGCRSLQPERQETQTKITAGQHTANEGQGNPNTQATNQEATFHRVCWVAKTADASPPGLLEATIPGAISRGHHLRARARARAPVHVCMDCFRSLRPTTSVPVAKFALSSIRQPTGLL